MVSKEKLYRDKRIMKMRNIVMLTEDLVLGCPKSKLKFIDLAFLKKTEQELQKYHNLLKVAPKISEKIGEKSE